MSKPSRARRCKWWREGMCEFDSHSHAPEICGYIRASDQKADCAAYAAPKRTPYAKGAAAELSGKKAALRPLYPEDAFIGRSTRSLGPADLFVVKPTDTLAFTWSPNNPDRLCFIAKKSRHKTEGHVQLASRKFAVGQCRVRFWQWKHGKDGRAEALRAAKAWAAGKEEGDG